MILALIALSTCLATITGGLFALRFSDKLHLILGFSAGAVIGVAFFDLLPEAIKLSSPIYNISTITSIMALAFAFYLVLDRYVLLHAHTDEHGHGSGGILGAGSLTIHSFLDGIGIGFAFQLSPAIGAILAIAVLTHDFSDGLNTVNMILKNGGAKREAFKWLLADALAPILGIIATLFVTVPAATLGLILAAFGGFFFYIGASDLLPESHHGHPTIWTSIMTVLGMLVLYSVISFAQI